MKSLVALEKIQIEVKIQHCTSCFHIIILAQSQTILLINPEEFLQFMEEKQTVNYLEFFVLSVA